MGIILLYKFIYWISVATSEEVKLYLGSQP